MSSAPVSVSFENRLDFLSRPKMDLTKFRDRPSVYWVDRVKSASECGMSARQEELAQPKLINKEYKDNRNSPMWPVSSTALLAVPSPRLEQLAQGKGVSPDWKEDRSPYSTVSEGAKKASATTHTLQLSQPKICNLQSVTNSSNHDQQDDDSCSKSEKSGGPTARTEELAVPKTEHPEYMPDGPVQRPVPAQALKSSASDRVCQLAKPKPRKAIFEGYDPYKISTSAKQAEASPRILELCVPPARRLHSKKT
ncbi:sperm microtubule associated protein 2-like [Discoglossus pictus]